MHDRNEEKILWYFRTHYASHWDQFGYLWSFVTVILILCRKSKYESRLYVYEHN